MQSTKKLVFSVTFNIKMYCIPEIEIDKDTSWERSTTSKKIKAYISHIHRSYIESQKEVEKKDFNIKA